MKIMSVACEGDWGLLGEEKKRKDCEEVRKVKGDGRI